MIFFFSFLAKDNKYLPYAGTRKGVSSRGSRAIDRFSYVSYLNI